MSKYVYRLVARTEAAGKYDPSAPREGNEDSFGIIADVGSPNTAVKFDTSTALPDKGVLMVVADGMGGHSAGEIASQIAVNTVRDLFSEDKITDSEIGTAKARATYLESVVVAADKNIREDANANPERKGMGSTIVLVWIVGNELTVTWCGDSRAYRYRPGKGLEMLSEDHSMVQDLVRKRKLSYEETFSHPQGNIITHCLGGGGKGNAEPESRQFTLEMGDIIMLCSDGLSGVVFDYEKYRDNGEPYSTDNLQDILARPKASLKDTISCLFDAARRCDWYDNVTAILFEMKGTEAPIASTDAPIQDTSIANDNEKPIEQREKKTKWMTPVLVLITLLIGFLGGRLLSSHYPEENPVDTTLCDSTTTTDDSGPIDTLQESISTTSTAANPGQHTQKKIAPKQKSENNTDIQKNDTTDLTVINQQSQ